MKGTRLEWRYVTAVTKHCVPRNGWLGCAHPATLLLKRSVERGLPCDPSVVGASPALPLQPSLFGSDRSASASGTAQPYPIELYVAVSTEPSPFCWRKVGIDGLVSFVGRRYCVPFRLISETVEVSGIAGAVQVLTSCELVAEHPRGTDVRLLFDQ